MPEKVLLVCTSTPANVRKAVGRFPNEVTFQRYALDLLCTSGDLMEFENWPGVRQVLVFPNRKAYGAAFQLWIRILRQRYDVVVVFWSMEPGRALAKTFALVCNGRRVLVFNENIDCAFLSFSFLMSLLKARIQSGAFEGNRITRVFLPALKLSTSGILRLALFPLRFVVLLISVALLYLVKDQGE